MYPRQVNIPITPGKNYTVRVYYRNVTGASAVGVRILWKDNAGTIIQESPDGTGISPGGEGYAQLTAKAPANAVYATPTLRRYTNTGTSTAQYKEYKFEEGDKATSWSPAPEDTDAAINDVKGKVETAEGEIRALAGEVALKASETVVNSSYKQQ